MSTITKEQLRERARQKVKSLELAVTQTAFADSRAELEEELELARIALASLEAEAVAWMVKDTDTGEKIIRSDRSCFEGSCQPLYTAPPAPVSVPDDVLKGLLPDVEKAEFWFEHNGKILFEGVKFNNAVFNACRAAMLQGAEPVTTANKLPDDFDFDRFNDVVWLEAVASNPHMHSLTTSTIAMVALELNKRMNLANSPAIPDGWVMAPVEPTEDMIVNGFESEPDESFSDEREWEAYDAMSGCQQAAHRAKLCWAAMIAAAPKPEVK